MAAVPCEDDVFDAVAAALEARAGFAAALPGGVHAYERPPAAAYPFAVVTVEPGEPEWTFEESYLQSFAVGVAVVDTRADSTTATTRSAKQFLAACLGWLLDDPTGGLTVNNAAATVAVRPRPGRVAVRLGAAGTADRVVATARFDVVIQGATDPPPPSV